MEPFTLEALVTGSLIGLLVGLVVFLLDRPSSQSKKVA